jgi:hypothetical protein
MHPKLRNLLLLVMQFIVHREDICNIRSHVASTEADRPNEFSDLHNRVWHHLVQLNFDFFAESLQELDGGGMRSPIVKKSSKTTDLLVRGSGTDSTPGAR